MDRHATVGLLTGNGNHCDFVVEQSMTSTLDRREIEAYYRDATLPAVSGESQDAQNGRKVSIWFDESHSTDGQLRFTLRLADIGYPPGFDIRCH
jgi:hypothetical protein